jgi:predicted dehydrogenase
MKLRLALIGTGGIAGQHVRPNADPDAVLFPEGEAEFVAVMDIDGKRAEDFAEKYGIPAVYTDVDELLQREQPHIVCIATPPKLHTELSIKAMEAGAWVLCEKPLCASLRELDAIQEAEKRTGNYCSSVFQFRFGGAVRHMKQVIDEELAGRVLVGTCHTTWYRDPAYYEVDWRGTWDSELGGPTMIHGIHAMDTFLWLMGDWVEVRALCSTVDRNIEVEDVSSASVLFKNGAVGNILNSILCPHERTNIRFDFQRATAWTENALYDLNKDKWRFMTLDSVDSERAKAFETITDNTITKQTSQLRAMVDDYREGRRPLVSGQEARSTIEFITALYKSAATGTSVRKGSILAGDPFYEHVAGTYALNAAR